MTILLMIGLADVCADNGAAAASAVKAFDEHALVRALSTTDVKKTYKYRRYVVKRCQSLNHMRQ